MTANELKEKGNEALQKGDNDAAVKFYTEAIALDSQNHVLFSNRSAAYCKANKYDAALRDAEMCIKLKPEWGKGYSRKGAALEFLSELKEARQCYQEGLKREPANDQLKEALGNVEKRIESDEGTRGFPNPFMEPGAMDKLRAHPKTRGFADDPSFQAMLGMLKQNPNLLQSVLSDQRIMTAFGVLMGIDFDNLQRGPNDGAERMDAENSSGSDSESNAKPAPTSTSKSSGASASSNQAKQNSRAATNEAEAEKEKGNEAYRKREFEAALTHYDRAITLEPTSMSYRTNKAAVLYEQGKYTECITECEQAIEVGRENRADFKLIAKALARIGNAYVKLNDLANAKRYYERSVTEHREREVVLKLQDIDKKMKDQERLAYIDPAKAEEEKQTGNMFFQDGKFPEALKHYTEAIKRNPDDAKLYSNRAACYVKLLELQLALRDCEECIRLDSKFIKGYLRKGQVLMAMKEESSQAAAAYRKALELDPNNEEARDGLARAQAGSPGDKPEEVKRRAMQDPEVQAILGDPAMQLILQQMQKDPRALRDHLQNEEIASKIQKLIDVGIIGIR